jgi:hypothetical protein
MSTERLARIFLIFCRVVVLGLYSTIGYFVFLVWSQYGAGWGIISAVLFPVTALVVPILWAAGGSYLPLGLIVACLIGYKLMKIGHDTLWQLLIADAAASHNPQQGL